MADVKSALEIAEDNIAEDKIPLPEQEENKLSEELQGLLDDMNNPEYFGINNIMGIHGQPLISKYQQFDLFSDELEKSIVFEAEKVRGRELILRSTKVVPEGFFKKKEKIELLSKEIKQTNVDKEGNEKEIIIPGKVIEFEITDVKRKGLTLIATRVRNPDFRKKVHD